MKIVVDPGIPLVETLLAQHVDQLRFIPGRKITASDLLDADALLVRSITPVNADLLAKSPIQFVGTATIGIDHLDLDYLNRAGIRWAYAPGCNARAVVEYVLAALAALSFCVAGKTVGIIGCGNVGRGLYLQMQRLGAQCRVYDPFLTPTQQADLCSLEEVLQSDLISLHTPLTHTGAWPTHHMLGDVQLNRIPAGTVLINCGRGAAIETLALKRRLRAGDITAILDVWENEPAIDPELLSLAALATPHIAGYSWEGKVRGTQAIVQALTDFFDLPLVEPNYWWEHNLPLPQAASVQETLLAIYDPRKDDAALRAAVQADPSGKAFDALRSHYALKREFGSYAWAKSPLAEEFALLV